MSSLLVYNRAEGETKMASKGKVIDIQWIKFGDVDSISFVGKESIVLGYDNYIVFLDPNRPDKEVIYRATSDVRGDGVHCLCTHRSLPCFAFAEKCRNPRILVNSFPNLENVRTIEANQEAPYISLRFSEMEYLVALVGLPSYSIVMWNWRTLEKVFSQETSISVPRQVLRVSPTAPLQLAQAAPEERALVLWDVHLCYKKAVLDEFPVSIPEKSPPPYCHAWGMDGDLYVVDSGGNLYSVAQESKECILALPWKGDEGRCRPALAWYKGGWAYAGPGRVQYCRRKSPEGWTRIWSIAPETPFKSLISSSVKDLLFGWNETHELILFRGDPQVECVTLKSYGSNFDFVCLLHPVGDILVTYSSQRKVFTFVNKSTGNKVTTLNWTSPGRVNEVRSNPLFPYLLVMQSTGRIAVINAYDLTYLMVLHDLYLSKASIDTARFHSLGTRFCVANLDVGEFFLFKFQDPKLEVLATAKLDLKIVDFALVGDPAAVKLVVLPVSQLCCRSGQSFLIYAVNFHRKLLLQTEEVALPTPLTAIAPKTDDKMLCIPHRSRTLLLLETNTGEVVERMATGHQMKCYNMRWDGTHLVTFGFDGIAVVRRGSECVTLVVPHHRMSRGIHHALVDPYCRNIITLGADGTLVCFTYSGEAYNKKKIPEMEALLKSQQYKQFLLAPIMIHKAKAKKAEEKGVEASVEEGGEARTEMTWLEAREQEKIDQEENQWRSDRQEMLEEVQDIRQKLKELLDANLEMSKAERLPIQSFDLDKSTRRKKIEDAKAEREKEKYMQLATVKARDKVSDYIRKMCWDSVQVKGREIHGVISPLAVESYPLPAVPKGAGLGDNAWSEQRLKMEHIYRKGDYFEPWVPRSASMLDLHINTRVHISELNVVQTVKTKFEEDELEEQTKKEEGYEKESAYVWSGTATHNFIEISPYHYTQFEMTTYIHGTAEIRLIQADIRNLMIWFNKQFDQVFYVKEREVAAICEKHNRFRHIINELNFFKFSPEICRTVVSDPKWSLYEQPERIMRVEDAELSVTPYLSHSQQELISKKAAEAERLRQMLLADDFKEKALVTMMDGVLEKLWESEIKKEVPKPKCMVEKEPEAYTEDDYKAIRAYEEAVKNLLTERERYRKILEGDWVKLLHSVRDITNRFDDRLSKLHILKMKVDSAIKQEVLKILRIRYKMYDKWDMQRKEESIREEMHKNEKKMDAMQSELSKLVEALSECRSYYETLQNRDRNLDKNFKKEFPDLPPIVCEQLYKTSKKRPKLLQKAALFSTLLLDLGKCVVSGAKADYLTSECIQYLKDIDALDNSVNAPTSLNEQAWDLMCKMRRTKIECELKVRACAVDLGEAEATVSAYYKKVKTAKELQSQLQNEIQSLRQEKLYRDQNFDIQLVLKSGLVEIPLTGRIADFDECILVTRDTLTEINAAIIKAGNQKIKAMTKAANFRKGIIFKEWEHKKLRMEIEDLQNKLTTLEKIKVTKELQSILIGRARGFTDEKGFLYMEDQLTATKEKFKKTQSDLFREIDDYNMKIDKICRKNEELDSRIAELNVDVNELRMQIDKDFDEKQLADNMKRMKKVRHRSRLVQKIQENHNEILMLETELELLRLRTFPTLK